MPAFIIKNIHTVGKMNVETSETDEEGTERWKNCPARFYE
jgi:hypothetical protein